MSKRIWFYTFSVLDASGAISSSQLERLTAPIRALFRKLFRRAARVVVAIALLAVTSGCVRFGYSDRVLWRLPSPDGNVMAVCQEIPEFDGPGYDIRLESPDGTVVKRLYRIGDGDPCTEMAWSPDGRTLAVLSGHVARLRIVDVHWALTHADLSTAYWSWRQVDLSSGHKLRLGKDLRFVGPQDLELTTCAYDLTETQRTHTRRCTSGEIRQRLTAVTHS